MKSTKIDNSKFNSMIHYFSGKGPSATKRTKMDCLAEMKRAKNMETKSCKQSLREAQRRNRLSNHSYGQIDPMGSHSPTEIGKRKDQTKSKKNVKNCIISCAGSECFFGLNINQYPAHYHGNLWKACLNITYVPTINQSTFKKKTWIRDRTWLPFQLFPLPVMQ